MIYHTMIGKAVRYLFRKWRLAIAVLVIVVSYYFCLPEVLFEDPYSTVLESKNGQLLSASIAEDGQWRFPPGDKIPRKFREALVQFEDRRFFTHPGVDPLSVMRALHQNIRARKTISGASTISMQVIRLSRKGRSRSFFEKTKELILATRLELRYSKEEILNLYSAHAPFGGNVVGLEAACWRYFGRTQDELSWAEAALLAVLPNSPSLIHPAKNRDKLKEKRDLLLDRLLIAGKIDSFTCVLSKEELIPGQPVQLPRYARHLLGQIRKTSSGGKKVLSTVDFQLQVEVEDILRVHHLRLSGNHIYNAAAIVAKVDTGEILAYVGNVGSENKNGSDVDVIQASRSTGSILKPFLYAAMLDDGKMLPRTLIPDVPTMINGFTPKNFSKEYDGAVPADKALIRSLNVPAVHMLREFRYEKLHKLLHHLGMNSLTNPPDHYGLSLILGGAEGSLFDIVGMYASMARTLNNFHLYPGKNRYDKNDVHALRYEPPPVQRASGLDETSWLSAGAIYLTFDALKELYRPGEETGWRYFESSKNIAWKTGTSFGFRDGWAVGVNPEYVVGVWIGNASGEGRPGLTGTDTAAPVLFDIFSQLNGASWFKSPTSEMKKISTCKKTGFRNSPVCPETDTIWVTHQGLETLPCPFHKKVHLSHDRRFQLNNLCAAPNEMRVESWFILPPVQESYYRSKDITYHPLPPFKKDCPSSRQVRMMDLVYPKPDSRVFIPRDISGKKGNVVFQVAHRSPDATVFWHIDGEFLGSTRKSHAIPVDFPAGKYKLLVIDEEGEMLEQEFEILSAL